MRTLWKSTKRTLAAIGCAACLLAVTPSLAAPVLLGAGTLDTANDLTIIQNGNQILEFLDLTPTQGESVAGALSRYSGFRWATGSEVATLYSAFGFGYASFERTYAILNVSTDAARDFVDYLSSVRSMKPGGNEERASMRVCGRFCLVPI